MLHVGADARDAACYLFLDACVRVKAFLDESWPLPVGMAWPRVQPRRGKSRRGGGGPGGGKDSDSVSETTETAETAPPPPPPPLLALL